MLMNGKMMRASVTTFVVFFGTMGCSDNTEVVGGVVNGDAGSPTNTGGAGALGFGGSSGSNPVATGSPKTIDDVLGIPLDSYCKGKGAALVIPGSSTQTCSGDLAAKTFRFALCSCTNLSFAGSFQSDSFDSQTKMSGLNASVGTNGKFDNASRNTLIGGSLWAGNNGSNADSIAVSLLGDGAKISGQLQSAGGVSITGSTQIGSDIVAMSSVRGLGSITVGGKVRVPEGAAVQGITATGGVVRESVSVQEPCDCKAPIDIPKVVDAFVAKNDNLALKIDPAVFNNNVAGTTVELPCGRFALTAIKGINYTLKITGRTLIAVAGDVSMAGALNVVLAPGAELDLFIKGNVSFAGESSFGSVAEPARIRVYIGGNDVSLAGGMKLGGNLYAPFAQVGWAGDLDMAGSLFGKKFGFAGSLKLHYDEAILKQEGCQPPGMCSTCNDCPGGASACKAGMCTGCTSNNDCCAPLACVSGKCQQGILVL